MANGVGGSWRDCNGSGVGVGKTRSGGAAGLVRDHDAAGVFADDRGGRDRNRRRRATCIRPEAIGSHLLGRRQAAADPEVGTRPVVPMREMPPNVYTNLQPAAPSSAVNILLLDFANEAPVDRTNLHQLSASTRVQRSEERRVG